MQIGNLDEFIKTYHDGVYDFTENGKCIGCGNCCSNLLPLSEKEISDIRSYVKNHKIKKQKHVLYVLKKQPDIDMLCPFLDDSQPNKKCTIYPVRPLICKDFICAKGKVPDKRLYYENRKAVDMAETFF